MTGQEIVTLTNEVGDVLPPGLYLLEVEQPPAPEAPVDPNANPAQALIILSNANLALKKSLTGDSLAWLTDLRTGEPLADQPVQFYLEQDAVSTATTDGDGIARTPIPLTQDNSYWPVRALVGEPGDANFAAVSSEWNNGIAIWDFGLNGGYSPEQYQLNFYTERPIYRPGQTVYWKGMVRVLEDAGYTLPPQGQIVSITVRDDRGNAVIANEYPISANGTVDGQVELADTAVTGYYYLEARIDLGDPAAGGRTVYGGVGFQVAAYHKPEFQIDVTSAQPDYVQGETVQINVQANYFSGGALGNAPVSWRLIANPYSFNWQNSPPDRYYSFTAYDPDQENVDPYVSGFYGLVQEGKGMTAADGSFVIELPANLQNTTQSQLWLFDVTVQSSTNQFVSGSASVPIHNANFYIGLSPQEYVVNVGAESAVDIVTVTPQGEAYPGAALDVVVYEYEWNSVYARAADGSYRWETSVQRTPLVTTTTTTDHQGEALIAWTPTKAGQYQIVASGQDEAGNATNSATYVYVSTTDSGSFVAWPRDNNDRIQLVADKQLYEPGDSAKILVPSPF